ncbi:PACE efflux transporter [Motiliproteus sp.]|uniref:PACE efflux transporter n=1 Tax=Motiliproteus sp. TaxID=1898955 RepID=UPI003BA87E40
MMSTRERIFHALMFEIIAIALFVPISMWVTGQGAGAMTGLAITLSLIAMSWNYVYNILFDRYAGEDRINRSLKLRMAHSLLFEAGLMVICIPVIMWWTRLDLLTVFLLDLGAILFFLVYTLAFNWAYDHGRHRLQQRQMALESRGG